VTQVAFQKDGTSRADLQVVINVLSEAGVQRFGQLVFAYNSAIKIGSDFRRDSQGRQLFLYLGERCAGCGAVRSGGAPAYSDYREKRVTVPGLRPGDAVAYHIARTITMPSLPITSGLSMTS